MDHAAIDKLTDQDWLIWHLVQQNIRPNDKGEYFSGFIGSHAEALRHLCRVGIMAPCGYDIEDEGRVFSAELIDKGYLLL